MPTGGAGGLEGLVSALRAEAAEHLHGAAAEPMTPGETSFFRDMRPFEALRETVIPALLRRNASGRSLRIWSAACSTGQEAYSIAMLLLEHFPEIADWDVEIVGTDISPHAIDCARRGSYRRAEVNRGLPARLLVKYFTRDGDTWEIAAKVRAMCRFSCVNLCEPQPWLEMFDLVMLRNVLFYFPEQDRSCVLAAVHRHMHPRGYLLLGNAEQAEDSTDDFEAEFAGETYFYRPVRKSS